MYIKRLSNNVANSLPGIQGRKGILKDHPHVSSHLPQFVRLETSEVLTLEEDLTRRWFDQP
jgi:hypothetical protein